MNITAEAIKAQQNKVAEMIAAFKAANPAAAAFPVTVSHPELNEGETYIGCIISANGRFREHIILLPDTAVDVSWKAAMDWAASIGGSLPNRVESALLFAVAKDQFEKEWHWTCEQGAHNDDYAWMQGFDGGGQVNDRKSGEYRARAVRRLLVIE